MASSNASLAAFTSTLSLSSGAEGGGGSKAAGVVAEASTRHQRRGVGEEAWDLGLSDRKGRGRSASRYAVAVAAQ